ncbi:MAG TPA: hypothetical protein VFB74_13310 [Kribbellaceae bacterium]|nr:hypothetical protein [Kribbellaceae bacterium]
MLTTQISGTRNGQLWPPPGTVIDLPDDEANALVPGSAVEVGDNDQPKIFVPPAGVHTPGVTAHGVGTQGLVEVPVDALTDPQGTRDALKDVAEGNLKEVPAGVGVQKPDGSALTSNELDKRVEREEKTREAYEAVAPTVGSETSTKPTTAPTKATKSTDSK